MRRRGVNCGHLRHDGIEMASIMTLLLCLLMLLLSLCLLMPPLVVAAADDDFVDNVGNMSLLIDAPDGAKSGKATSETFAP